jgi:Fic-DOC domain mobile mystery protein B
MIEPFAYSPGATPLDPDEAAGLIPSHIRTQAELNQWEEANILTAQDWLLRQIKSAKPEALLSEGFVRDLHKRMFKQTWRWAGSFRSSNKNIGIDWPHIATRLRTLLGNTLYQIEQGASSQADAADKLATHFHHQLVCIHPFPNGNGRHARLMADALVMSLGQPRFTWGQAPLEAAGNARERYLTALRAADVGEWQLLYAFVRS